MDRLITWLRRGRYLRWWITTAYREWHDPPISENSLRDVERRQRREGCDGPSWQWPIPPRRPRQGDSL